MADEPMEGNVPSTSEATPPHIDDSPEMVNQPSPPEEERVTSSTDHQPPEKADSPDEQRVSSTSEQEMDDGAGPSNQEPVAGPSSSDSAPVIRNQPLPEGPNPKLRKLLEAPIQSPEIDPNLPLEEQVAEAFRTTLGASIESSQEITKDAIKRKTGAKSDDSNQQLDADDLSPRSSRNVDVGSEQSPTGSGVCGEERRVSGSSATDEAGLRSNSSPKIGTVIQAESGMEIDAPEKVGIESELSASKTGAAIPSSGTDTTEDVGLKREISPSKASLAVPVSGSSVTDKAGLKTRLSPSKAGTSVEGSGSASGSIPEKPRDNVSPKRKIPSKVEHLPPKRSAPFSSPDEPQTQSESQMSTLLKELDIEETKVKPESSEPISEQEQKSIEMKESEETQKEETDEESNMEVQEPNSQNAEAETTDKYSKKDDME